MTESNTYQADCATCGAAIAADQRFCRKCGTAASKAQAAKMVCPQCGTGYPESKRFCRIDGTALKRAKPIRDWSAAGRHFASAFASAMPSEEARAGWFAVCARFVQRHAWLLGLSAILLLVGLLGNSGVAAIFGVPVLLGWIVSLSRTEGMLQFVASVDRRFLKSYQKNLQGGRFRRWLIHPLYWCADRWNGFASRTVDRHVFAGMRVLGYISLVMAVAAVIAAIAYIAIVVVLTILMFALAFWVLGFMLDAADGSGGGRSKRVFGGMDPLLGGGRRGGDIHRGKGGWFGSQEKAGRIDEHGNIFEGKGGWFGHEEKIGRIDDNGTIYEGSGGLFGSEEVVGRRNPDGTVYEGTGGLFGQEEQIGRVAKDGQIYRGKGGWFDHEEKIGRTD